MRITSRKNTSSLQETPIQAEIRSQPRITCNTPNITSVSSPRLTLRRRLRRAVSNGRPGRTKTVWTMTANLTRCPIVSPRLQSGRTHTSSRNRAFNRNQTSRPTLRSPSATDLTRPIVRAAMIAGALRLGRIVSKATDFRIEVRDRIARSRSAMRVTATIDRGATIVRGISGPTAIPSRPARRAQRRRRPRAFRPS